MGLENDSFNSLRVYCLRFCNRVSRHGCDVTESFIDNGVFFLERICNGCRETTLLFRNFQSFIQYW